MQHLADHIASLGGLARADGEPLQPFTADELVALSALIDAPLPAALRWFWSTYGGDCGFVEPVVYIAVPSGLEVMIGDFVDAAAIHDIVDDLEGARPRHRIPFNDDASGNYLVADAAGPVAWHIHDALLDRNQDHVADSFEQFVLMLRRGE